MKLWSHSFDDRAWLPPRYAFGRLDNKQRFALSDNLSPHFAWDEVPDNVESFVLLCVDRDAPAQRDDVNVPGRLIREDVDRSDFFHWALVDLAANVRHLDEGQFSRGVTPGGKNALVSAMGTRQALNSYTEWFADDNAMRGDYFGYDGPCPPTNDLLIHRYHFILYALNVPRAPVEFEFHARGVQALIAPYVIADAEITARYSLHAEQYQMG